MNRLSEQLSLTVLASVLGAGGLFLLTRPGGPELIAGLGMWPFPGTTLVFVALTLGARVLAGPSSVTSGECVPATGGTGRVLMS